MTTHPAGVLCDMWGQLPSGMDHLPAPGPEGGRAGARGPAVLLAPHSGIQAVDRDVLHRLGAQQVQELHLHTANAHFRLFQEKKARERRRLGLRFLSLFFN